MTYHQYLKQRLTQLTLFLLTSSLLTPATAAGRRCSIVESIRKLTGDFQQRRKSANAEIPESYLRRNSDVFQIRRIEGGRHGGSRLIVERLGNWSDSRKDFSKGGGDITLDLRLWPKVLGESEADYFGYRVLANRFVSLPDEHELNGAIRNFNRGIEPTSPEFMKLSFYPTQSTFIKQNKFINNFGNSASLPLSTEGRQFFHDVSAHGLQGLFMHNEFIDIMQARAKLWVDFVNSEAARGRHPLSLVQAADDLISARMTSQIDQSANMMALFIHEADRQYLHKVGNQIFREEHNRQFKSDKKIYIDYGEGTLSGFNRSDAFVRLVSGKPTDFFEPILQKEYPELERSFKAYVRERSSLEPRINKTVSFDWQSEARWLEANSDKIANKDQSILPELARLELIRPYLLRMIRLRELSKTP